MILEGLSLFLGGVGATKGPIMRDHVEIENIEAMRLRQGIDDIQLREDIRKLEIGDFVKLTFLATGTKSFAGETLLVKITSIRGSAFRGKLVNSPASTGPLKLRVGSPVAFSMAHIHSLPKGPPTHEQ